MKSRFERNFGSDLYMAKQVTGEAMGFILDCVPRIIADKASDLRVVINELLMNAVKHGNQFDSGKSVGLYIEVEDGRVYTRVTDEGDGFDYRSVLGEFKAKKDLMSERGRGVWLAYNMTDTLQFYANGSEIAFCMRLVADE